MNIKAPLVLDTAYDNLGSNWSFLKDTLAAMYIKATEGYFTKDPQFASSWMQMQAMNKPRAAYHFYRESWFGLPRDPIPQARFFYKTVMAQGFIPGDKIVLDAEDKKMTIQKILACGREMRRLFNQWPLLYTGFYFLKDNTTGYEKLTAADIADLKQMKLIISAYPDNPDAVSTLPSIYVPDQSIFGEVIGWQYAGDVKDHGLAGVKGSLNFDLFNLGFLSQWRQGYVTSVPLPPAEPPSLPPAGYALDHFTTTNYYLSPVTYHVARFSLKDYDIVVDNRFNFMTTDQWLKKTDVDYAINGLSGWYLTGSKKRPVVALDGSAFYHGRSAFKVQGWLNLYIDQSNRFSLMPTTPIWNAQGFPNLLIVDGVIQQPDRHPVGDVRARTAIGVDKDQTQLFVLTVDGKDYWEKEGMNFQQVASIMKNMGCDLAVMGDGGGSTTAVRKAPTSDGIEVVGTPWGEETRIINDQPYKMRIVAVHFGLKRKTS